VLGYTVGFLAGFGVPKDIDQGPRGAWPTAAAVDLGAAVVAGTGRRREPEAAVTT